MSIQAYSICMDKVFRSLSDRNRLRIMMVLQRGPLTVNEISAVLGLTQPNASRHLKAMNEAGVLKRRGVAGRAWYSLNEEDPLIVSISGLLASFDSRMSCFTHDLSSLSRCYDQRKMEARRFFSKVAEDWDEVSAGLPDQSLYSRQMERMAGEGETAVELGCGTGGMIPLLRRHYASVIGVDSSPEMLDVALRSVDDPAVDLRLGTLEHLPVADSSADFALAHMVLHHLAEPGAVFPEIQRMLRSGGSLLVVDLIHHSDESFRIAQGDLWPGFEPAEIESWASRCGFDPVESLEAADERVMMWLFRRSST